LIVSSIYGAGEAPVEGVTAEKLARAIQAHGHRHVNYIPNKDEIVDALVELVQPNDIVITVGAGDIWQVGRALLEKLRAQ
jgi:UDP-N-acetylmuramate--alanine ligase